MNNYILNVSNNYNNLCSHSHNEINAIEICNKHLEHSNYVLECKKMKKISKNYFISLLN